MCRRPNVFDQLIEDLAKAKKPALLIGGGCARYKEDFWALGEVLQIPAFPTWNALDVVASDLAYYGGRVGTYGGAGGNMAIQNADLLLAIGSRISGRITGGMPETFARCAKKYFVDVDEALLDPQWQPVKADVNILRDAGEFMRELKSKARPPFIPEWRAQCIRWRDSLDPVKPKHFETFHHYGFMRRLSDLMPANAIIVADTGGNVITFAHAFKTKKGQRYFTNNGNTPMGFAMCGAMGAWFADPTRPVICIIGDGGMNMNIQELQTIVNYGCKVKVFLFNNHILGNTKSYQLANYAGRCEGSEAPSYVPPSFQRIADAYDIDCDMVDDWRESEWLTKWALGNDDATILEVVHHDFCEYRPRMIKWDKGIEEMEWE